MNFDKVVEAIIKEAQERGDFENLKGMTPKGVNAQQAALASVITQKVNRDVHGVELAGWEADYMVATVFVDGQKALDSAV